MRRTIEGWHRDDEGDWVAELSCLHGQHVRHRPPFREAPWVDDAAGREARLGTDLHCPLCDRTEEPDGLVVARTTDEWSAETLPAGLRRAHRVAEHRWGRLHVTAGEVRFRASTGPPVDRTMHAGDVQPIPPTVLHEVSLDPEARVHLELLRRP